VKRLNDVVGRIVEDKEFQKKNTEMDMILAFAGSAAFQKDMGQFKENVSAFFVEQGLVKK
jgi:hypothetical protein